MAHWEIAARAESDIADIWDYIFTESKDDGMADRAIDRLEAEFDALAESPGIGHVREDIAPRTIRFRTVYSYAIAYREIDDGVLILAVLHGARNLASFFS